MGTTFYTIGPSQAPRVWVGGEPVPFEEFEVYGYGSTTIADLKKQDEGDVYLARIAHGAIAEAVNALKDKVTEAREQFEHVAVLVRTPMTVDVVDTPLRIVTEEGSDGKPRLVYKADGSPLTFPAEVGYAAFAVVAVVASHEPVECNFRVLCEDIDPPWADIPDLDEDLVRAASVPWKTARGRMDLIQYVVQSPPVE